MDWVGDVGGKLSEKRPTPPSEALGHTEQNKQAIRFCWNVITKLLSPGLPLRLSVQVIGPSLVALGEGEQLALRIWEPTSAGNLTQPGRQFPVVRTVQLPPISISEVT